MGTPDFAVRPLEKLIESGYKIVGVVTMPDKPAGRGHKIKFSPVKEFALQKNLKILQPEKLKDEKFLAELIELKADLQIVVAFRILPEVVWSMPKFGTINLHASLLPQYRGAAPINWAIINGETTTGITTFLLQHEIDTGNIILQQSVGIQPNDTSGTLHDRLMEMGADLVLQTIRMIEQSKITSIPQIFNDNQKPAPKIFKDDCKLDFFKQCVDLHNFVRGLSPYPAAWFETEKGVFKVFESQAEKVKHSFNPGKIITDGKKTLKIAVLDGFLHIKNLQASGKNRMSIEELLRGNEI
jgi:methionyl-tRNA formyltransferase